MALSPLQAIDDSRLSKRAAWAAEYEKKRRPDVRFFKRFDPFWSRRSSLGANFKIGLKSSLVFEKNGSLCRLAASLDAAGSTLNETLKESQGGRHD